MLGHRLYLSPLRRINANEVRRSVQRFISTSRASLKNRKKDHWHTLASKKFATDKALDHFDDFYKSIFRLKWPSVRLGMLMDQKYVALLNNFGDTEATTTELEAMGAMNMKTLLEVCERNGKMDEKQNAKDAIMEDAFALDNILETRVKSESDEEMRLLYPDGKEQGLKEMIKDSNDSEAEEERHPDSINEDSYFRDRLIDPCLGIDSGVLHDFVPATKLKGMEDYVAESEYYSFYKPTTDVPVETATQYHLPFPENLKVFTYDRGVFDRYPQPKTSSTGVYNYFLMDGASLMPVLALDVKPGDVVLDMCSAPGGKALAIIQSMTAKRVVCNDASVSRVNRMHKMFSQYLYDYEWNVPWKEMVTVQQMDACCIEQTDLYDKILVDVPCTNDRLSLRENDNNIFKQSRIKERLRIPEIQSALLANALRIVKPGGTVVYSTCSLSPVQNDGVVGMALRLLWEQQRQQFTVVNLQPGLKYTSHLYNYGRGIGLKYGTLVVPFLPSNFGPMYFSKIVKAVG